MVEEAPGLKEYSKVPQVVTAWGEKSLGEVRVIEAYQARVTGLQMAEGLILGMGWVLQSLLVFGERQWS